MNPVPLRRAIRTRLLPWFARNRRDLPWRRDRTPYKVWISEAMLQQTRVETVVDYFTRFVKTFPSVRALSRASRQEVLKLWEGLGYYSRARHLHEAARQIVERHGGRFPTEYAAIRQLPGIGDYTAAAIASLAFGQDRAVVDGNVIRVLSRLTAHPEPIRAPRDRRALQELAASLLVKGRAGECNEALMELGACVCLPRAPRCAECPLANVCHARAEGDPARYPLRAKRPAVPHKIVGAGVVIDSRGRILIAQRLEKSMLGGLWEFPGGGIETGETMPECIARELREELGIDCAVGECLVVVHHAYTHFTIDLHAHWAALRSGRPHPIHCADFAWTTLDDIRSHPFSRADLHILDALDAAARQTPLRAWRARCLSDAARPG